MSKEDNESNASDNIVLADEDEAENEPRMEEAPRKTKEPSTKRRFTKGGKKHSEPRQTQPESQIQDEDEDPDDAGKENPKDQEYDGEQAIEDEGEEEAEIEEEPIEKEPPPKEMTSQQRKPRKGAVSEQVIMVSSC